MEKPSLAAPSCATPPAIDDCALIAAIDGEADAAINAHLSTCPACAARAHDYADLQTQLRRRLFRLFCPSSEELALFQQRALDLARAATIAQHCGECPHCTRELHLLGAVLGESPPDFIQSNDQHSQRAGPANERC